MKAATGGYGKFRFNAIVKNHAVISGLCLFVFMGKTGVVLLDIIDRRLVAVRACYNRKKTNVLKIAYACSAEVCV